jgi:hypothetical protein
VAPGAGLEPAHIRINSAAPSRLGYPGKGGREPGSRTQCFCAPNAEDCRFPCSRTSNPLAGPSGVEPESQASETCALSRLDDRPAWNRRPDSNRHFFVRTEAFYPLNDARLIGVAGENRTLVDWFTASRLNHSATATSGARSTSRTCFAFWRTWWKRRESNPHLLGAGQPSSRWTTPPKWSRRGYSKPRPPHYGCGAPPPELLRR